MTSYKSYIGYLRRKMTWQDHTTSSLISVSELELRPPDSQISALFIKAHCPEYAGVETIAVGESKTYDLYLDLS